MSINNCNCKNSKPIIVEQIQPDDIQAVVNLYRKSFRNHFLGHMGQRFLTLFVSEFVNSADNFGYVAWFNHEAVGFILATTTDTLFSKFYRKNFPVLAVITMSRYFRDPFIRKHIGKRFGHIYTALKALFSFSAKRVNNCGQKRKSPVLATARLLAIAVDKHYRGLGVASKLTSHFCKEMKVKGFKQVGLSTLRWNRRAINFYQKDGWTEEKCNETSVYFSRIL
ncbi:GNAT family N-acetyltransferase [Desulfosporosinus sp. PR]|uniref:GNAT family N-acetyltransferase n=1 Tax=Candidatus Desulfosporosinus nitrosoreducens TaxID=3401928 RepID=UPI0027FFDF19|nr:GNAT family N-acetyltransferase [Desulfosporosinus sp. PR]MDQ7093308.1 GNAT family N-acetyltransferase [Desulfosporosinus sp. PR]